MRRKIGISLLIIVLILFIYSAFSFAADSINPDEYKSIYTNQGQSQVFEMSGGIIAVVRIISVIVAVVMLTALGIRYLYASPNDRASIKDRMIPFIIGALIIFGASFLLDAIAQFARTI